MDNEHKTQQAKNENTIQNLSQEVDKMVKDKTEKVSLSS